MSLRSFCQINDAVIPDVLQLSTTTKSASSEHEYIALVPNKRSTLELPTKKHSETLSYNSDDYYIDWIPEKSPALNMIPDKLPADLPLWIAVCFSLNYIIGSGVLSLPREYFLSGYILGTLLLLYMAMFAYCVYQYVVYALIRSESITCLATRAGISHDELLSNPQNTIQVLRASNISTETLKTHYVMNHCDYQLSQLIGIFCGKKWRHAYQILFAVASLVGLWSYFALFALSLSRTISISFISDSCNIQLTNYTSECRLLYSFFIVVFWLWAIFITSVEFRQQSIFQITITSFRFLSVFLMTMTSIVMMYSYMSYNQISSTFVSNNNESNIYGSDVETWKWSGIAIMIAASAFSYGNQFCVTDVNSLMHVSNRSSSKQSMFWAWVVCLSFSVYLVISSSLSLFYGDGILSPCTLLWKNFVGFSVTADVDERPIWASILSWFVVVFPAMDIASSYPLLTITFCNTYQVIIFSREQLSSVNGRYYILCLRYCVCTLCGFLALFVWDFQSIIEISGSFMLISNYCIPCYMEYCGQKMCTEITGDELSHSTCEGRRKQWPSNRILILICVITSIVAAIAVIVNLIITIF